MTSDWRMFCLHYYVISHFLDTYPKSLSFRSWMVWDSWPWTRRSRIPLTCLQANWFPSLNSHRSPQMRLLRSSRSCRSLSSSGKQKEKWCITCVHLMDGALYLVRKTRCALLIYKKSKSVKIVPKVVCCYHTHYVLHVNLTNYFLSQQFDRAHQLMLSCLNLSIITILVMNECLSYITAF